MKIIIAGSRTFNNYELLKDKLDKLVSNLNDVTIISGTAQGADQLGERYAAERGYKLVKYPAEWDKYGKSAGYKRNEKMASVAYGLVAFWDGKSNGTKHMIDIASTRNLKIRLCLYKNAS